MENMIQKKPAKSYLLAGLLLIFYFLFTSYNYEFS